MNGNAGVGPGGPDLASGGGDHVGLGAIKAGIGQRHLHGPFAAGLGLERNIAPEGDGERVLAGVGGDDFLAETVGLAKIGAEDGARAFGERRGHAQD